MTPRFFNDSASMLPIDHGRSVSINVDVQPFQSKGLALGFTRGFTQSQAFVHNFSLKAPLRPQGAGLLFNTKTVAGTNSKGQSFTFADEYQWSGYTARARIFEILSEVVQDKSLTLCVFAYDLNEPDVLNILLELAKEGRISGDTGRRNAAP